MREPVHHYTGEPTSLEDYESYEPERTDGERCLYCDQVWPCAKWRKWLRSDSFQIQLLTSSLSDLTRMMELGNRLRTAPPEKPFNVRVWEALDRCPGCGCRRTGGQIPGVDHLGDRGTGTNALAFRHATECVWVRRR